MVEKFLEICLFVFGNQAYNVIGWTITLVCTALIALLTTELVIILKGE